VAPTPPIKPCASCDMGAISDALRGLDVNIGIGDVFRKIEIFPDTRERVIKPLPDPNCRWCKGTGRVKLLVTETECPCD